ncbi:MAG TPA: Flp pilus assembly protein CpaB [Tepidisphaeraceae bacterium]|jgi:pilus assembly protein CpaB|nr:Flp pilus assembly protein CpaB [Tepidisphaeraceae bacterium]
MNVKKFLPLIAAAGLGLVALIIAHSGLGHSNAGKGEKTVSVIVAKENVPPGQTLTADNLDQQVLGASSVPPTAYTRMEDVVGRVTVAPMVAGQPVLDAFLASKGALPGLPALVPPGMRAVTIDVNETTGVAGLLVPGSRVDLVSVINQGEHEKTCARTIASNVPVVAVGQRLGANKPEGDTSVARTVTLIAKPREAELIKLASVSTNMSLVLRGNGDVGPADSRGVIFTDLTSGMPMFSKITPEYATTNGGANNPPSPLSAPQTQPASASAMASAAQPTSHVRRVEIIQGSTVSVVSFEMPETSGDATDGDDYTNTDESPLIPSH